MHLNCIFCSGRLCHIKISDNKQDTGNDEYACSDRRDNGNRCLLCLFPRLGRLDLCFSYLVLITGIFISDLIFGNIRNDGASGLLFDDSGHGTHDPVLHLRINSYVIHDFVILIQNHPPPSAVLSVCRGHASDLSAPLLRVVR